MTGLRIAFLLCVFLIQRVASQSCNCQSELYISIDDLMKALNNGPGIPGLIDQGQSCGCQQPSKQISVNRQSCGNQDSCGYQPSQPSKSRPIQVKQPLSISNMPLSLGNQCGCQPSPIQQCDCQPSISFSQPIQQSGYQPSISVSQPSQQCGCQPSISFSQPNQQCGCQQSLSISQPTQQCGCQPSISFIQPSQQCGCQPSISFSQPNQQCGCQQSLSISQPSQQCGCQPSISFSQPSQQCGCQAISINQGNSCGCQSQPMSFQQSSLNSQSKSNQGNQVITMDVPAYIVPAALLEAPPYGIIFAGDNLLIDGAVQVCGNMPFSSIVELSGVMPTSGSGCVQYTCNDGCD